MSVNPQLVAAMLQRDLDAARQLQSLLDQERELLQARNHDTLPELITAKNAELALLDAHATERRALLESLGVEASTENWEALLQSSQALAAHLPLWRDLQAAIKQCQGLNEINGKLIGRSQQTIKRLLDLMRGNSSSPQLYTASGNTAATHYSHSVVKA